MRAHNGLLMKHLLAFIDWFIPTELRYERSDLAVARNFVFTHLFGPLMSQMIILFLHRTDAGSSWQVWTITACVWLFWVLPFMLKVTGKLSLCAFLSVQLLAFVSLFGAFFFGGVASPFLPWLIVSLLLGFFYLSKHALYVVLLFGANFLIFSLCYHHFGFNGLLSSEQLEVVGWFSIFSAMIYMSWMAVFYTTLLSARDELIRQTEELEETTRRLHDANREAEVANANRSIFLAKISHELRTPLNAVIGYSEMIIEAAEGSTANEQKRKDLMRINAAGRHLLSLVDDVLDLSRIEKNEIDVKVESVNLNDFAANLYAGSESLVSVNGNRFVLECGSRLGEAHTDVTKLRQVALNLISNAAKFTKNGLVTLSVRRDRSAGGDWLELQVRDTGIGIAPDELERLFKNFSQATASTSSRFGGTGLGLAHSQKLSGLLGGRISVSSEPGRGATFTLRMPIDLRTIDPAKPQEGGATHLRPAFG